MPPRRRSARLLYLPASLEAEREGVGSACGVVSDVPSRRGARLPSSSGISGFLSVGGIRPSYAPRRLLCSKKNQWGPRPVTNRPADDWSQVLSNCSVLPSTRAPYLGHDSDCIVPRT